MVASLTRWSKQSIYGKDLFTYVDGGRPPGVDKYTVELKLKEKVAIVQINLAVANNFAAIYPKEIAEKFPPAEKVTEYVGTGPFKLVEWKPDQYIQMVRFDDYKPRSEKAQRLRRREDRVRGRDPLDPGAGRRDPRRADGDRGARAGRRPERRRLRPAEGQRQRRARSSRSCTTGSSRSSTRRRASMTNQKLRQALAGGARHRAHHEDGGRAAEAEFYRMDYNLIHQEMGAWHVKMQGLPWNEHNKEKAKQLLQEAGYKGEPIRFMATQEYKWMYDFALVSKQQLEDAGFNIDLQVVDWATLVKRRNNSKEYDAFTTGIGPQYDPTNSNVLSCSWPGWTCDEQIQTIKTSDDPRDRLQEAVRALGADAQGLLREGSGHPATATSSGSRAASKKRAGPEREDGAGAALERLAGQVARS